MGCKHKQQAKLAARTAQHTASATFGHGDAHRTTVRHPGLLCAFAGAHLLLATRQAFRLVLHADGCYLLT